MLQLDWLQAEWQKDTKVDDDQVGTRSAAWSPNFIRSGINFSLPPD